MFTSTFPATCISFRPHIPTSFHPYQKKVTQLPFASIVLFSRLYTAYVLSCLPASCADELAILCRQLFFLVALVESLTPIFFFGRGAHNPAAVNMFRLILYPENVRFYRLFVE